MPPNNIIALLILILFSTQSSYACGGCQDPQRPMELSNQLEQEFQQLEQELSQSIQQVSNIIENEIKVIENSNTKELEKLNNLSKENTLIQQEQIFLLKKQNSLQDTLNSINAVE